MSHRPYWLAGFAGAVALASTLGCPSNNAPTAATATTPHSHRLATATPAPKSSTGTGTGGGTGGALPTAAPTLKPPGILASAGSLAPLPPGQAAFALGQDANSTWGLGPYLLRPRAGLVAAAVGPLLLAAEGEHRASLEVFDPQTGNWAVNDSFDPDANPGATGHDHGGGLLFAAGGGSGTELWLAGGFDGQLRASEQTGITNVFLYRAKEGFARRRTASEGQRLLDVPVQDAAGAVWDKHLYLAGGFNRDQHVDTGTGAADAVLDAKNVAALQIVDVGDGLNTLDGPDMPVAVSGGAGVALDGHFYVLGGFKLDKLGLATPIADVQDYDTKKLSWVNSADKGAIIPPLPAAVYAAAAVALPHTLYIAGGMGADNHPVSAFYRFDFNDPDHKWREMPSLPTPRAELALVAFGDGLWAIGGIGMDGQATRTVEKFFTEVPAQ